MQAYNRLVLQHQDEAFTLAYDLLGDDAAACETLQTVFLSAYRQDWGAQSLFRLQVLRGVIQACLRRGKALPGPHLAGSSLAGLTDEEKCALVLVDCLGLTYPDAAFALTRQVAWVAKTLAAARRRLVLTN